MKLFKYFLLSAVMLLASLSFADRQSTTTTTDPAGNVSIKVFFGPYIFETKQYKGNSTLLSTTDVCYNGASYPCVPLAVTTPVTQKDIFLSIPGISGPSQAESVYNVYGLATDSKVYNYGPSLVNEGVITYSSLGNTTIKNRPNDIVTKDSGGTKVAETQYTYDSQGNTLTKKNLVSGSTYLTETFTYTAKGVVATSTGVNGATTTYTNGPCNGIFASSIAYPPTGTQTFSWNCLGGLPTSTTDVNGSTDTVSYSDPFWRPTLNTDALGVATVYKYKPTTDESIVSFSNSINDTLNTVNTSGRVISRQVRQSNGSGQFDTVSVEFDNLGRMVRSSVPCTAGASSSCSSMQLSMSYDTGSVPTTILTDSLGGVITTQYSLGDETTTLSPAPSGEGVKGKQLEYDALGRLLSTCEISNGPGSGSCGQRVAQTGYVTTYAYDAMGNLLTITQGSQTRTRTYDDLGRVLTSTEPESGTTTFTYDTTASCGGTTSNGDLVKKVDANGNTTCYKYDAVSRLTSVTHSGPNATDDAYYVYDSATVNGHVMTNAKGRVAEAYTCTSCPGTKKTDIGFSYDAMGQTTDIYQSTVNSGGYYHVALTLYANQAVKTLQMTPAVIPTITYGLDGEGRTSSVQAGSTSLVQSASRGAGNQISSLTYGSSGTDTFGYDALLRMTQYSFSVNGNSVTGAMSYSPNGTLSSKTVSDPFTAANNETCGYTYDDLIRLSSANCGVVNQSLSYDRYGNITKSGSFSFAPTYSSTTNRMTAIGVVTPTYDANGNLLTDGTSTYTWDSEGRMLSGPGVDSIIYNAMGLMAEQTRGATHQQIVYFPSGEKLALMNGQSLNLARVPLPAGSQAVYTSAGLSYLTHADGMGSVRMTTDATQALLSDFSYAPFGEPYNSSGVPTSTLAFTGLNQDTVTGLYDTSTRKYNPLQSRWVSSDTQNSAQSGDPQTFNLYSYADNRPLELTDITGSSDDSDVNIPELGTGAPAQDPSSYDPYGFLKGDSEQPLVYNAGVPAGGASGDYSTLSTIGDAMFKMDPTGLVAGFDVPFFIGPYEGADNVILRIARGLEGTSGSGVNSLKDVEAFTSRVLDGYGSSLKGPALPQLAMGLTNPGLTREEVRALPYGTRSGLNRWADSIGAKSWSSFYPPNSKVSLQRGLFTLMQNVVQEGGTIHFNLDGLLDIAKAVDGTSVDGVWVESLTGGPRIKVPYNNGVTIAELRFMKYNWDFFKGSTIFYRGGKMLQSGAPSSMGAFSKIPFEPWGYHVGYGVGKNFRPPRF